MTDTNWTAIFQASDSPRRQTTLAVEQVTACAGGTHAGQRHQARVQTARGQESMFAGVMPVSGEIVMGQTELAPADESPAVPMWTCSSCEDSFPKSDVSAHERRARMCDGCLEAEYDHQEQVRANAADFEGSDGYLYWG